MPIQRIASRVSLPLLGKFRLGIKRESKSGSKFPTNAETFLLHDLPEYYQEKIREIYGDDPRELDVIFPLNDLEKVAPCWLTWYAAGVENKDGSVIGGKLMCRGNGPDEQGNPGTALFYGDPDPVTGLPKERECLGENCPDWNTAKGYRQCKPLLTLRVMLPRVTMSGVFGITTTSWYSIQSFYEQMNMFNVLYNGVVAGVPLKLARIETAIRYKDQQSGKEKVNTHHIMKVMSNEGFFERHRGDIEKVAKSIQSNMGVLSISAPSHEDDLHEDYYPRLAAGDTNEEGYHVALPEGKEAPKSPLEISQGLVEDPEIKAGFDEYESLSGKSFSPQKRLLSVRKFEGKDDQRDQVLATLRGLVDEERSKKEQTAAPMDEEGMI